jgi:hypothetical protein
MEPKLRHLIVEEKTVLIDDEDADYDATTKVMDIGQSVLNHLLNFAKMWIMAS